MWGSACVSRHSRWAGQGLWFGALFLVLLFCGVSGLETTISVGVDGCMDRSFPEWFLVSIPVPAHRVAAATINQSALVARVVSFESAGM